VEIFSDSERKVVRNGGMNLVVGMYIYRQHQPISAESSCDLEDVKVMRGDWR